MKKVVLLFLLQITLFNAFSQEVIKETHLYSIKGTDSLRLDRYYTKSCVGYCDECCGDSQELKPAIIFMFGGAFYTGTRDEAFFIPCFEYYAQRGYEVFSIDYRLGLKTTNITTVKKFSKFVDLIDSTINLAVEDLYDATSYIVDRSTEWSVDPSMIVSFGSSAGAISVLQAEYYRVNGAPLVRKLPENFQYAGVISMAGAIFSMDGELKWEGEVAPILMFQGSADSNVPYNKKRILKYGFYGSKAIAKSLKKEAKPYYFYTFEGAGHEIAGTPMDDNREDIDAFLQKFVKERQPLEIVKTSTDTSKPKVKDKFSMKDYLKANFKTK